MLSYLGSICVCAAAVGFFNCPKAATLVIYGRTPFVFESNQGQANEQALYIGRAENSTALIRRDGVTFIRGGSVLDLSIDRANQLARFEAEVPEPGVSNYYLGTRSILGLTHYGRIRAHNILDRIDVVYHGHDTTLEYDFVLAPGAKPGDLSLHVKGKTDIRLAENGDLLLGTGPDQFRQPKPRAWQDGPRGRREVECDYKIVRGVIRFALASYDPKLPLTIDPVISYSTFLGGSVSDSPAGIAVNRVGSAYIVGTTLSSNFPVPPGSSRGSGNVFVTQLDPSGSAVVYSTFIGGSESSYGAAIAIDNAGNAYITGSTHSRDFPATTGSKAFDGSQDAFVAKLSPSGTIVYLTRFGGLNLEVGTAVGVDNRGTAYVAGTTYSEDFPVTPNALRRTGAGPDAFVASFTDVGSLLQATYLGGNYEDSATAIQVNPVTGVVAVAGDTNSTNFPTTSGAYQTHSNGGQSDAFLAVLNAGLTGLNYSTYLGGASYDSAAGLAIDAEGNYYMTGSTNSSDFPTTAGAFIPTIPSIRNTHAFVTKISAGGTLVYSTFLGGNSTDQGTGIAVDSSGAAYVSGWTQSNNFPKTRGALHQQNPELSFYNSDGFFSRLSPDGGTLVYSTLLGGASYDSALGIALQAQDAAYLTGTTSSASFPTTSSALQVVPRNLQNTGFVTKITFPSPHPARHP